MGRVLSPAKKVQWCRSCLVLVVCGLMAANLHAARELSWSDLQPEGYELDPDALFGGQDYSEISDFSAEGQRLMDLLQEELDSAPPVTELDGQKVRLTGFVLPLVRRGRVTTRFFLVPYYGTCIHSPPPPANQLVEVRFPEGNPYSSFFAAVEVTGRLSLQRYQHRLGTSAYTLEAEQVEEAEFDLRR